jgi:membrane-bound lytic murein transglycosylase D
MEEPIPMKDLPISLRHARRLAFVLLVVIGTVGCAVTPSQLPPAQAPDPVVEPVPAVSVEPTVEPAVEAPIVLAPPLARTRLDPADDAAHSDLWQRVRAGLAMPDVDNDLVRKWEQFYAARPDYVQRMTTRGSRYLFHIVEETSKRGMPAELALLPFTESAFNPQAKSIAAAAGMWQFMPMTGKHFELKQNVFRDDRRDVLASTRAALDYLGQLYDEFKDWHLALAAYNWGQGNLRKAIARNAAAGLPTDYESLRLPQETREYVPKLQAVKNIVLRPADFGLTLPPLENHPFFLSVPIRRDIDVALAARLADLPLEEFQQLNPQMNQPVILAAGTPQVLLPYDNANRFVRQLEIQPGPLASWTAWVVPKTVKPAEAALAVGMSEALLREVNHIPARMLVKAGSTLLVPRGAHSLQDVAEHIADGATLALAPEAPPLRKISFKAGKKGDTVAEVAKRYHVSAEQVAQWNGVGAKAAFKPGQGIVVMQAAPAARLAARLASSGSKRKPAAARVRVASK